MNKTCLFLSLMLAVAAWPQVGRGQNAASDSTRKAVQSDTSSTGKTYDTEGKKKEMKIFLDKIEILGRVEKPQTVFILPGRDPTVDDIEIDRSFFKEIFRTVEKDEIKKIVERKGG